MDQPTEDSKTGHTRAPRLLLAATETRWLGAARFPKAARDAGWEVALLTPRGALVEQSRAISTLTHLPHQATTAQWIRALAEVVATADPHVIVPCDDMTFRLLAALTTGMPAGLDAATHERLAQLIEFSLGDPAHYVISVDKLRLPDFVRPVPVRFAESITTASIDDAKRFAATHGFPVVLKRAVSTGGTGVAICRSNGELEVEFPRIAIPRPTSVAPFTEGVLVQRWLEGSRLFQPAVAWNGRVIAAWCAEVLECHPAPKGPACVRRQHYNPAVHDEVVRLVAALGMSGMFSVEFIVERATGIPFVLEINRRAAPSMHRGALLRVDMFAGLLAASHARPSPTRSTLDPGEEHIDVAFPQEWIRDPDSAWLARHPVDIPWDEPELLDAYVRLWKER
jgi:hypothetical protein